MQSHLEVTPRSSPSEFSEKTTTTRNQWSESDISKELEMPPAPTSPPRKERNAIASPKRFEHVGFDKSRKSRRTEGETEQKQPALIRSSCVKRAGAGSRVGGACLASAETRAVQNRASEVRPKTARNRYARSSSDLQGRLITQRINKLKVVLLLTLQTGEGPQTAN